MYEILLKQVILDFKDVKVNFDSFEINECSSEVEKWIYKFIEPTGLKYIKTENTYIVYNDFRQY